MNSFCCIFLAAKECETPAQSTHSSITPVSENYYFGSAISYMCDTGYERVSGDDRRICQANQTWSGAEIECTGKSKIYTMLHFCVLEMQSSKYI